MKRHFFLRCIRNLVVSNIQQKLLSNFLEIKTHLYSPRITKGLKLSIKISIKSYWVAKSFWRGFCRVCSSHRKTDSLILLLLFLVIISILNLLIFVHYGLVPSLYAYIKSLKLVEIDCQNKSLIFLPHKNLDSPKIPKPAITFDVLRGS